MNRYYIMPEYQGESKKADPIPQLSLPQQSTPADGLQASLQKLNQTPGMTDEQRWKAYEQIFQSFLNLTKPHHHVLTKMETSEEEPTSTGVLHLFDNDEDRMNTFIRGMEVSLPTSLKSKGDQLLLLLSKSKAFQDGTYTISPDGHLRINGQEIANSNLMDLIHHALRRTKQDSPAGWPQFYNLLKQINVPKEFLAVQHRHPAAAQKRLSSLLTPDTPEKQIKLRPRKRTLGSPGTVVYKSQKGSGFWSVL